MDRTIRGASLAVVSGLVIGVIACQPATSSTFHPISSAPPTHQRGATPGALATPAPTADTPTPARDTPRPTSAPTPTTPVLTEADGVLPARTTVFDDEFAGVANLDTGLLDALREAADDAAEDGINFRVTSGWRSPEYQNQLLREAIEEYGSEEEAARWVASPDTSPHVSGDAVDIGFAKAREWLSEHGAHYGLCQIYRNEPWHFELRSDAMEGGCPPMYANPTRDPRMQ